MAHVRLVFQVMVFAISASPALGEGAMIRVTPVRIAKGDVMHVQASIRISASPEAVWAVLSDCARAPQIVPHLERCRIVDQDPLGRWDVREHLINPPFLPKMRTLVRNDFIYAKRLGFRLISGDMKISDGAWTLKSEGADTVLSYEAHVAPNFVAPQFLVKTSINTDFPRMLSAIGKASMSPGR